RKYQEKLLQSSDHNSVTTLEKEGLKWTIEADFIRSHLYKLKTDVNQFLESNKSYQTASAPYVKNLDDAWVQTGYFEQAVNKLIASGNLKLEQSSSVVQFPVSPPSTK